MYPWEHTTYVKISLNSCIWVSTSSAPLINWNAWAQLWRCCFSFPLFSHRDGILGSPNWTSSCPLAILSLYAVIFFLMKMEKKKMLAVTYDSLWAQIILFYEILWKYFEKAKNERLAIMTSLQPCTCVQEWEGKKTATSEHFYSCCSI